MLPPCVLAMFSLFPPMCIVIPAAAAKLPRVTEEPSLRLIAVNPITLARLLSEIVSACVRTKVSSPPPMIDPLALSDAVLK